MHSDKDSKQRASTEGGKDKYAWYVDGESGRAMDDGERLADGKEGGGKDEGKREDDRESGKHMDSGHRKKDKSSGKGDKSR